MRKGKAATRRDAGRLPMQTRAADVAASTLDDEARTVEVVFTTGAAVERVRYMDFFGPGERYVEVLDVSDEAVRLERLNDGGPVLDSHREWGGLDAVLGAVERAWIAGGEGRAMLRFASGDELADKVWNKLRQGVLRKVSVGYVVHRVEEEEPEERGAPPTVRVLDWEPYEISVVAMPADPGAGVRSADRALYPCVIERRDVTEEEEARMPDEQKVEERATDAPEKKKGRKAAPPKPQDAPPAAAAETDTPQAAETAARAAEDAVKRERERVLEIREAGRDFGVDDVDVEAQIAEGASADAARRAFQKLLAKRSAEDRPQGRITVSRDAGEATGQALISALMHSADRRRHRLEGAAEAFRGLGLMGLARTLCEADGVRTAHMSDTEVARRALQVRAGLTGGMGVSDFSYITTEVMNRMLMAEYEAREPTYPRISRERRASDFRELWSVRAGGDFQLLAVNEQGEYESGVMQDEAEGLKVTRKGRRIALTFEAIVNDDLGAFERVPGEFARAARNVETAAVWGLIRTNAVLKSDNTALFHATKHGKNLAAAGAAISATTVGAGRKVMWEQKALGVKDADGFINVAPDILAVPPALEIDALQFITPTTPATDANANPFKASVSPLVEPSLGLSAGGSDTAWYLFASDLPPCEHAFLDGYEGVQVMTEENSNPDGVTMTARHIFGAAVVEFRGAYKDPGA